MECNSEGSKQGSDGVGMNILIVGDPSGNDDEGMKKIGRRLAAVYSTAMEKPVRVASVKEIFTKPGRFEGTEIIHHMGGPSWRTFVYARLIKLCIRSGNTKTVISFIHPNWSFMARIAAKVFSPDAAIVQSVKWKNYCESLGLIYWDGPMVGVDLKKFCPVSSIDKMRIRDDLGLPRDKKIVLHVGHLRSGRNLKYLEKLVMKDKYPVVIASTTGHPNNELASWLESKGVLVINKYIQQIEKYYQAADCYVFPTVDPKACIQVPLSVLEAIGCGLPVVTTRYEGLPMFFSEESSALIYVDDLDTLPTKVNEALSFPGHQQEKDLHMFDWAVVGERLLRFYEKL